MWWTSQTNTKWDDFIPALNDVQCLLPRSPVRLRRPKSMILLSWSYQGSTNKWSLWLPVGLVLASTMAPAWNTQSLFLWPLSHLLTSVYVMSTWTDSESSTVGVCFGSWRRYCSWKKTKKPEGLAPVLSFSHSLLIHSEYNQLGVVV